ncbi:MAG: hypothetical protein ACI4MF_13805 [Candidatus Faecivicinus sp.]
MLSKNEKINAISWKCDELGISYGKLMCRISESEIEQIYDEYEKVLSEREKRFQRIAMTAVSTPKEERPGWRRYNRK